MSSSPPGVRTAWLLGMAGLLPFMLAACAMWAGPQRVSPVLFLYANIALLAYAATIASFLGGARWGAEVVRPEGPRPILLVSAVAPQLVAVALLVARLDLPERYGGLLLVLLVQGISDALSPELPDWYRRLRIPLTAGAVASVAAGLAWALVAGAPPPR